VTQNPSGGEREGPSVLAQCVQDWIDKQGWTQTRFAVEVGIDQRKISQWLRKRPQLEALPAMERALDLPVGYFLRRAGYVEELRPECEVIVSIRDDDDLSIHAKKYLIALYEAARNESRRERSSSSTDL
jgi:transcriptional regulator with XRE-family HTH domain